MKKFDPSNLTAAQIDAVIQYVFGVPLKCLQPQGQKIKVNVRPWELAAQVDFRGSDNGQLPFHVVHRETDDKGAATARDPFKRNAGAESLADIMA